MKPRNDDPYFRWHKESWRLKRFPCWWYNGEKAYALVDLDPDGQWNARIYRRNGDRTVKVWVGRRWQAKRISEHLVSLCDRMGDDLPDDLRDVPVHLDRWQALAYWFNRWRDIEWEQREAKEAGR